MHYNKAIRAHFDLPPLYDVGGSKWSKLLKSMPHYPMDICRMFQPYLKPETKTELI